MAHLLPDGVAGRWRQADADPGRVLMALMIAALAVVFLGFVVYHDKTGSWTVLAGTLTTGGALAWFGPLFAWFALYAIGPRGPFRGLWKPPIVVEFTAEGIGHSRDGGPALLFWSAIASASTGIWASQSSVGVTLRDVDGQVLARLPGRVTRPGVGRRWLIDLIIEARPDRYRASGRMWRGARLTIEQGAGGSG